MRADIDVAAHVQRIFRVMRPFFETAELIATTPTAMTVEEEYSKIQQYIHKTVNR